MFIFVLLHTCTYASKQWRMQGVSGVQPPEPEKNGVENVISERSIFRKQIFTKIQKFNLSIEFSSTNFKIFLKISQPIVFFVHASENLKMDF